MTDLFWILFILAPIQPAMRQRLLEMARLRTLRRLEQKRGSRTIALIHRQETLALLGFPLFRYIDVNDSEEVLRAVRLTAPDVPIDLIMHTPGGLVLAAEQIAHALCCREAPVTVRVPQHAMSGGTLIALAAHEIVMDFTAALGPVDPQLEKYPAVSILKAVAQKDVGDVDDETLILADVAEKAIRQVKGTVTEIVEKRAGPEAAEALTERQTSGAWTHDYPITADEAREWGLSVSTEMPQEVYDLMQIYPQAARRRPPVQYVPIPYRRDGPERASPRCT